MTNNEKTTLLLSIFALLISASTFYMQNMYVSNHLEAIALTVDPAGGIFEYQVAIVNPGNKNAVIKSVNLYVQSDDNVLHASNPLSNVKLLQELPIKINSNDILTMTFIGPIEFIDLFHRGRIPEKGGGYEEFDGEATREIFIGASFESIDYKGNLHEAKANILSAFVTKFNVASWTEGSEKTSLIK